MHITKVELFCLAAVVSFSVLQAAPEESSPLSDIYKKFVGRVRKLSREIRNDGTQDKPAEPTKESAQDEPASDNPLEEQVSNDDAPQRDEHGFRDENLQDNPDQDYFVRHYKRKQNDDDNLRRFTAQFKRKLSDDDDWSNREQDYFVRHYKRKHSDDNDFNRATAQDYFVRHYKRKHNDNDDWSNREQDYFVRRLYKGKHSDDVRG